MLEFSCKDKSGDQISTLQLCYVSEKLNKVYLSRQGCIDLGMLDNDFPTPKNGGANEVAATHGDSCTCTCPERSAIPPPLPTALPEGISAKDDKVPAQLKQWLLDHYASTVFNVCEHQQLPLMSGNPLELHVDPSAIPVTSLLQSHSIGNSW